ncbi:hypothetical protein RHGRI_029370 [Rhododendron griersonianum]|uniref:F-box associated domain-containing protein n=1 Tax=Rhododendron griersonianum TaxID=479676 RepID=A0AAV6IJ50_9ERIC|nr:hypothetical protein RHGRI_029370 [Rhododendron griersonianum]
MESPYSICAFDIEKESFQGFSTVPGLCRGSYCKSLGLLEGRLCVCDNSSDSDLVIWVMKDPIKVWRNGDILMIWRDDFLYSYSPQSNTLEEVVVPRDSARIVDRHITYEMMLHVASFCSLKDLTTEEVHVF